MVTVCLKKKKYHSGELHLKELKEIITVINPKTLTSPLSRSERKKFIP